MCTPMFIAMLFIKPRSGNNLKARVDEWIKTLCCIYLMDSCPAGRKDVIFPFLVTWMEPKGVRLSELVREKRIEAR